MGSDGRRREGPLGALARLAAAGPGPDVAVADRNRISPDPGTSSRVRWLVSASSRLRRARRACSRIKDSARAPSRPSIACRMQRCWSWAMANKACASGNAACTITKALADANGRLTARSICRARTWLSASSTTQAWKRSLSGRSR